MPLVAPKPKIFKTYSAKAGEVKQNWYIVDAANQSLGRLSVPMAMKLMGKDKATEGIRRHRTSARGAESQKMGSVGLRLSRSDFMRSVPKIGSEFRREQRR